VVEVCVVEDISSITRPFNYFGQKSVLKRKNPTSGEPAADIMGLYGLKTYQVLPSLPQLGIRYGIIVHGRRNKEDKIVENPALEVALSHHSQLKLREIDTYS
jgi:hypothetical protein